MAYQARHGEFASPLDRMTNPKNMNSIYYTYILYSTSHKRYYIGQTNNLAERIVRHNNGLVTSTKPYKPWELVGSIEKAGRKEAMQLERKLKNLNTEDLEKFIRKYFNK